MDSIVFFSVSKSMLSLEEEFSSIYFWRRHSNFPIVLNDAAHDDPWWRDHVLNFFLLLSTVALTRLRTHILFNPIFRNSEWMYWNISLYFRSSSRFMNCVISELEISMYDSRCGQLWSIRLSYGLSNPINFNAWWSISKKIWSQFWWQ